jgi:hypothetical protein
MTLRALLARWSRPPTRRPESKGGEPADLHSLAADWAGLLAQLGLAPQALWDVARGDALHPHFSYRPFTRPKKDGTPREVVEPDPGLKRLQREVVARYFTAEQPHPAALAFRVGRSIADHAWTHAGAEFLVTADVQDFFPRTLEHRIDTWWRQRVADDLAGLLTRLTAYRGGLPQGAPTSPGLSNFLNRDLDEQLARRAAAAGARFSRYCDDLAFSWRGGALPPSGFEAGVRMTLHAFGYNLHPHNGWRLFARGEEPVIVGLVLTRNGRVRLPSDLRRTMQTLAASLDPGDAARLDGYKAYEKMVVRRPGTSR